MNTMILASDNQYVSIEKPTVLQSNIKQQTFAFENQWLWLSPSTTMPAN